GVPLVRTKLPGRLATLVRNAVPVRVWQSVQWHTRTVFESTSASKLICPQWQRPVTFMRASLDRSRRHREFVGEPVTAMHLNGLAGGTQGHVVDRNPGGGTARTAPKGSRLGVFEPGSDGVHAAREVLFAQDAAAQQRIGQSQKLSFRIRRAAVQGFAKPVLDVAPLEGGQGAAGRQALGDRVEAD